MKSLTIWSDKDMQWHVPVNRRGGRRRVFSNASVQSCPSIKSLFGLALRQGLGLVESLLRLAGPDWKAPDFSTVCRRRKTLRVQLPYRGSTTALDLLGQISADEAVACFSGDGAHDTKACHAAIAQ